MQPFVIRQATIDAIPLVVSIPHTGVYLPKELEDRLASDYMRSLPMTDWHLHHLYDFLPDLGVTTIHATWSRFVADLNRPPEPKALYPGRVETGLVAKETFWGDVIWSDYPDETEIARWRAEVHAPYHAALSSLLEQTREKFGFAILIDNHSVASRGNLLHDELQDDIYLGNRDDQTCGEWLISAVQQAMESQGLRVLRNTPYKGGYITDHYGRLPGIESLQIEMCQRVYMDESEPAGATESERFARARQLLQPVFVKVAETVSKKKPA